jgi:phenylalanyl-tRNA synthetase alpha chain
MTELRFKPAYNPYTEPSLEIFAFHKGKISRMIPFIQ